MRELPKDWKAKQPDQHLVELEKELTGKSEDDPLLRDHIRRLKFAWRKGRRFMPQAA